MLFRSGDTSMADRASDRVENHAPCSSVCPPVAHRIPGFTDSPARLTNFLSRRLAAYGTSGRCLTTYAISHIAHCEDRCPASAASGTCHLFLPRPPRRSTTLREHELAVWPHLPSVANLHRRARRPRSVPSMHTSASPTMTRACNSDRYARRSLGTAIPAWRRTAHPRPRGQ